MAQPGGLQPPVPRHRRPARPGVHRRARAPGLLGAAPARLDPVHAVAAPAAAARPDQSTAAGGHSRLPRAGAAQPRAEPGAGGRVADGPGRRGAHPGLGGERRVRDRLADGDVRLPAALPAGDRAVRARRQRHGGGVPAQHGAHHPGRTLAQRAALRGRVGARRAGAAHLRRRLLASLLGDPGVVGASRALDGAQGPPGRPVAHAAAVRARDATGRRRADPGDRRGHDRWDHRRGPWSLHRMADCNGSGNDAGPSLAAPGLRRPALALAAAHPSPHRDRPGGGAGHGGRRVDPGHRRRRGLDRHPWRVRRQHDHGHRTARARGPGGDVRAECRLSRSQDRPERAVGHRGPRPPDPRGSPTCARW